MRSRRMMGRLGVTCELPEDALAGGARVTWMARTSALVEGQHGVVELSDTRIRLRTKDGVLSIVGEGLALGELSMDAAMIRGRHIDAIAYDIEIRMHEARRTEGC